MTDPRVLVWPSDEGAPGWYRLRWPARAAQADGGAVEVSTRGPDVLWDVDWSGMDQAPPHANARALGQHPGADVVVIQRPARRWWAQVVPMLQAVGVRVVVDVDDRFDRIHPGNVAHSQYERPADAWHSWRHIDACCQQADLVTASTPALAARFGHGHGLVLPNLVPRHYLLTGPHQGQRYDRTVGWAGWVGTHPGDLETTRGAVGHVLGRADGWRLHVVGTGEGVLRALGVPSWYGLPHTATGWVPFHEYPARVAQLQVGVVPLADTPFNHGKSALKLLEMAAVGVPAVASPTPDNVRVHAAGVGLLAASPRQWARHLQPLLASPDRRADLAGRSKEAVSRWTYEQHAGRWLDAWAGTLTRRRETA